MSVSMPIDIGNPNAPWRRNLPYCGDPLPHERSYVGDPPPGAVWPVQPNDFRQWEVGKVKLFPDKPTGLLPWQCPGCQTYYAGHVRSCECAKGKP